MTNSIKQLARALQSILDNESDPPAPTPSIYLHERYSGPRDRDGTYLPDVRDREAEDAGYRAALEFQDGYRKSSAGMLERLLLKLGLRKPKYPREFEEGLRKADRNGRLAYFEKFVLEELATVRDPVILLDLGIYLKRIARGVVGEEEVTSIMANAAVTLVRRGEPIAHLAPVILGIARDSGYKPGTSPEQYWITVDRITIGLSSEVQETVKAGIVGILTREAQEQRDYREALERAKQTRYRRASEFLADRAIKEDWNPEQAVEMVAQVVSRTSEGRLRMPDEFRAALSQRFADQEFGTNVGKRIVELAHERERIRNELDWNAAGGGH
jgi:hypothetical protein